MKVLTNRQLKNNKGMTLVEVIVGVALLGIISAMILMVFTSGMMLAANAGDNTKVTGTTITKANEAIVVKDSASTGTQQSIVYFSENKADASHRVAGNLVTESDSSVKNETTINTFVPIKETL